MPAPSSPRPSRAYIPLLAAVLAAVFAVALKSYDVWSHLATGRWIVQHGRLPSTDPFTYTMQGQPWRLVNGLADVLLYGFERAAGEGGVVAAKVVFGWLTLTFLGLALSELRARRSVVAALMVLAAVLLQARYSLARPLIVGAALTAAGLWALCRLQQRGGWRPLAFFALALPLWPLVHGTALVGLAQLCLALACCALVPQRRKLLPAAAATLAVCASASAALPWWRDLWIVASGLGSGSLGSSSTAVALTAEWASGWDTVGDHLGHWLLMGLALGSASWRWRREPALLGLALLGIALAWRFGRNAYEGALLALPAFAAGCERLAAWLQARERALWALLLAPTLTTALGLSQLAAAPRVTVNRPFGLRVLRDRFPYDTLETLERLPVARLINDFPLGGFLIWRAGPWGVYCDGRTVALYDEQAVQRLFVPLLESAESLTAAADTWDARYGLSQHSSHPDQWMMVSPQWVPLHIGRSTTLFVRRTFVAQLPAQVVPLHLVRLTSVARWNAGWYRGIVADRELRAQLRRELAEAARLSPNNRILTRVVAEVAAIDGAFGRELTAVLGDELALD